jgi:hypothetical protein
MQPKSYEPVARGIATDVVHRLIFNVALTVGQENKDRRSMMPVSFSCRSVSNFHDSGFPHLSVLQCEVMMLCAFRIARV